MTPRFHVKVEIVSKPTPEQCRALMGELQDARTRLTIARRFAAAHNMGRLVRRLDALIARIDRELNALCDAAGIARPLWPHFAMRPLDWALIACNMLVLAGFAAIGLALGAGHYGWLALAVPLAIAASAMGNRRGG